MIKTHYNIPLTKRSPLTVFLQPLHPLTLHLLQSALQNLALQTNKHLKVSYVMKRAL